MAVWMKRSAFPLVRGRVDAGANVFDLKFKTGLGKQIGAKARTVVGHDAADPDAEMGEIGHGLLQETSRRGCFFVWQHGGEGDAGVVVDGDIQELPASAAGFILGIAGDAMAGLVRCGPAS